MVWEEALGNTGEANANSRDLLLQATATVEHEQVLGGTEGYPRTGPSQREIIVSRGHEVHGLTSNNRFLSLAARWSTMGWLRQGCAQLVVEGGRGKGKQEDDPWGPLVFGSEEPFKHAALGHL